MKLSKIVILFLILICKFSYSQTDTEFWFVAPEVTQSHGDNPISFRFSSFGTASTVTLYQPANALFTPIIVNIPADGLVTVDVTTWKDLYVENKPWDQVNNFGFHILATAPITAYYEVERSNNPDIFTLKGRNALGINFMIPTQNYIDNVSGQTPDARSSFEIVATENNTTITIYPSKTIEVGHNTPYTITLNRGQTYSATAASRTAANHLFGTRVVSDKPIAITIKDDSVYGNPCYDLLGDQIVPIELIGTEYIAIKGSLTSQEGICVNAVYNSTEVRVNGVLVSTINQGQIYKFTIPGASGTNTYIETSKPSYVIQVTGFGCETGMALLPPAKCTGSSKVAFARTTDEYFGLILFTESGSEDDFTMTCNGFTTIIPSASFSAVGASGFVAAKIDYLVDNLVFWTFPNNPDNSTADGGTAVNLAKIISTVGGTSAINYGNAGLATRCASATSWNAGSGSKYWQIEVNTSTYNYVYLSSVQRSTATSPRDFKVQYRIGAGVWTDIPNGNITVADNWTTGVISNILLPATCYNQASVFIRWIMTSNIAVNGGTVDVAGTSRIDDIYVKNMVCATGYQTTVSNSTGKFHCGVINGGSNTGCRYGYFSNYNTLDIGDNDILFNGCGYELDAGSEWTSFLWNTGETTQQITAQDSGWYWVDASKATCSLRDSIYIAYIPPISLGNDTSICYGDSVLLDIGTGYSMYQWSNGISGATINSITVGGGTYSVTVTDHYGCTSSASIRITQNPILTLSSSVSDVKCVGNTDGAVNLIVTGGIPPYTYLWSNGAVVEDISFLPSGNYNVTVTDAIGCSNTLTSTVNTPLAITGSIVPTNVSCYESTNGSLDLTVTGGNSPYTYIWSNGQITQDISGLNSGNYFVTITDVNLCQLTLNEIITKPNAPLSAFIIGNNVSCKGGNNGSTNVTVNGGTSPYTYYWSNLASSQNIINLMAGIYSVTVTDVNLCNTVSTITITEPANILSSIITGTQALCYGELSGTIDLSVTGGTPEYSYLWNIGQITEDINGVGAGTYSVTITDANLCTTTNSVTITQPTEIIVSATVINISCYGASNGSINLSVSGGTSPYTYLWSNGQTTSNIFGLSAGEYQVIIKDSVLCVSINSITIN